MEPPLTDPEMRALRAFAQFLLGAGSPEASSGGPPAGAGGSVASPAELRARYGDPEVRKNPKRWAGDSYIGAKYSQCPSDFLEELAGYLDWMADKESQKTEPRKHEKSGKFYFEFDRKDAALARGWARQNQGKSFAPPTAGSASSSSSEDPGNAPAPAGYSSTDEDDIPF